MRVAMASAAKRDDRANEDFTGAVPAAAVLIDGAGIPGGEATCRHGVAWYASRLGGALLGRLSPEAGRGLPALLAEAIEEVTDDHRHTCDVANPISPSAAVSVLRRSGDLLEYLVLGDAFVVLDRAVGTPRIVSDPREVAISRAYQARLEATAEGSDEYHQLFRVMAVLAGSGPAEIIRRVRGAEAHHQVPPDDATITHCTELDPG